MGSLNPVLWLFVIGVIAILDTFAFVFSVPFCLATYLHLKRNANRAKSLRGTIIVGLCVFLLLFVMGCLVSLVWFRGPLAM
jgi:Na+/proline symporter